MQAGPLPGRLQLCRSVAGPFLSLCPSRLQLSRLLFCSACCRPTPVLFFSLKTEGVLDRGSLHGSCPTTKGTKYASTKW